MVHFDLFVWWAITISGGIAFLILVSIYLYANKKAKCKKTSRTKWKAVELAKDFVFVWVLLGLLVFYIVSVNIGSSIVFAAGNIVVEAILIVYLVKSKHEKSEQASPPRSE